MRNVLVPTIVLAVLLLGTASVPAASEFTPILPLDPPKVVGSSKPFATGSWQPGRLVDGNPQTEFASASEGVGTHVDFDFGKAVAVAGFEHVDRNDVATVRAARLSFSEQSDFRTTVGVVTVRHIDQRSGRTQVTFPTVTARYVRWEVTGINAPGHRAVGGAEVRFFTTAPKDVQPTRDTIAVRPEQLVMLRDGRPVQPLAVTVAHRYAERANAQVIFEPAGATPVALELAFGSQTREVLVPVVTAETPVTATLQVGGQVVAQCRWMHRPVRPWTVYVLPHSHVDIGYTQIQTDVEKRQIANIRRGIELAEQTKDNPVGSRFKWNAEVLWAVESYMNTASPEEKQRLVGAVRSGQVGLDALYGNELTGLCRPEELLRLAAYATRLGGQCGVNVEAAMISDVPGYTWGTVAALAHAGVKYFSVGPNYCDRIGRTLIAWQNKPFYWVSPSGKEKVLVWIHSMGYALGHIYRGRLGAFLPGYLAGLDQSDYPYDLAYLRWNVGGDNGPPDEQIAEFVKEWNAKYVHPRLILATTSEPFRELERRYGDKLPQVSGDFTPYWEDGAASSAQETAINRQAAERLVQAETVFAMTQPARGTAFPAGDFHAAWRNVILYDEHTWGAHNSISQPDAPFVHQQWQIKQGFALDGEKQSQRLLATALQRRGPPATGIDVLNTNSWLRTDLAIVAKELAGEGLHPVGAGGQPAPSQRLSSGELAVWVKEVPPLAGRRLTFAPGPAAAEGRAKAAPQGILSNGRITVRIDAKTGAISSLRDESLGVELVEPGSAGLNSYWYLPGSDLKGLATNGPVKISVGEPGPLVASLRIESDAPGCKQLVREVRLIDGADRVELFDVLDKQAIRTKEGVHIGFPFHVPGGTLRMDIPWAVVQPEKDQIPGSCKNWFTLQRWADVSNAEYGVTFALVDAPLVEVGKITANLIGSQTNPNAWLDRVEPSQTLYSWVMNNHWHTNYKAEQDGPTVFRYAIRPHRGYAADEAARFGMSISQPLVVARAAGPAMTEPRLRVEPAGVLVTALKPSDDGRAWIVRLFGASGKPERATLTWADPQPAALWTSDTSERPRDRINTPIDVPAWGIVTLRAELP